MSHKLTVTAPCLSAYHINIYGDFTAVHDDKLFHEQQPLTKDDH